MASLVEHRLRDPGRAAAVAHALEPVEVHHVHPGFVVRTRLGVDVKVMITSPCIFCIENP